VRITAGRPADHEDQADADRAEGEPGDELTAELTASYWEAYDQRLAETRFLSIARQLPELIGHATRLAWQANRRDTIAAIGLNAASGGNRLGRVDRRSAAAGPARPAAPGRTPRRLGRGALGPD
jgi:hypothetical protein